MTWRNGRLLCGLACIGLAGGAGIVATVLRRTAQPVAVLSPVVAVAAAPAARVEERLPIARGDTLEKVLARAGIDPAARLELLATIRKRFDVRKLRAGTHLTLTRGAGGAVESLSYGIDADHELLLARLAGGFEAAAVTIPSVTREAVINGSMIGSLFESIERAGEQPELALRIAEIFAWDLDFYTDPREGDAFSLVIEKREYNNGQPPSYGRILAARYNNAGTLYEAFLSPETAAYYSRDGRSLQSAFLRSPLKFEARVSSRFSRRRLHPVLKIYRPHLGTDYAAPTGAPVQAVGAGRVTFSGRSGGAGNMVRIAHANGYESSYLHLSRRLVRVGQRVEQGQRIGLVGATGLATGPHLDFRLRRNGKYVDFERLKPPRASAIEARWKPAFEASRDRLTSMMDATVASQTTAVAQAASPSAAGTAP